ncbi:MAG: hypothetical protein FWC10_10770 [Lentimicrobiaceae bacterium]|nr:hypothetical protein [Lentimicrobiaceae bacterium]
MRFEAKLRHICSSLSLGSFWQEHLFSASESIFSESLFILDITTPVETIINVLKKIKIGICECSSSPKTKTSGINVIATTIALINDRYFFACYRWNHYCK